MLSFIWNERESDVILLCWLFYVYIYIYIYIKNIFSMLLQVIELFYQDSYFTRFVTMHKCNAVPGALLSKFTTSSTAKHMELVMWCKDLNTEVLSPKTLTFIHLTDPFSQSNLQFIQAIHFAGSSSFLWELNPWPWYSVMIHCLSCSNTKVEPGAFERCHILNMNANEKAEGSFKKLKMCRFEMQHWWFYSCQTSIWRIHTMVK